MPPGEFEFRAIFPPEPSPPALPFAFALSVIRPVRLIGDVCLASVAFSFTSALRALRVPSAWIHPSFIDSVMPCAKKLPPFAPLTLTIMPSASIAPPRAMI